MPFATSDLSTVQTSTDLHLDSLSAESQRLFDCLSHRAAEGDSLLQLRCDLFGLQLGVELRFMNLLDRHEHFASGFRREIALQLVDLRSLATDDDAGSR